MMNYFIGSANPTLSVQDVQLASRLVKDIVNMKSKTKNRLYVVSFITFVPLISSIYLCEFDFMYLCLMQGDY